MSAIPLSDEQERRLADALFEAQLSILDSITEQARRTDAFDAPRNITRLTQALSSLRFVSGQLDVPAGPWMNFAPGMMAEMYDEVCEDDG